MSDSATQLNYEAEGRVVHCPVCLSTSTRVEEGPAELSPIPAGSGPAGGRPRDGESLVAWCLDCGTRIVHLPEPDAGDPLAGMSPKRMAEMLRILQGVAREERHRGAEPQDDFERGLQALAECHDLLHRPFTAGCWRTAGGPARHLRYWWTYQFWPPLWLALRRWAARAMGNRGSAEGTTSDAGQEGGDR